MRGRTTVYMRIRIRMYAHACEQKGPGSSAGQCCRCWEWDRPLSGRGRRPFAFLRPFHGKAIGIPVPQLTRFSDVRPQASPSPAISCKPTIFSWFPKMLPLMMLSSHALLGCSRCRVQPLCLSSSDGCEG